jgi:hypothetical protein
MHSFRYWSARLAITAAFASLLGCDDDGFEEPGPNVDCIEPNVDELPFDRNSIEKLVTGDHHTTLQWRGPGVNALDESERSADVVVSVEKTGDLKWGVHCGGYVRFPVEVELAISRERHAKFKGEVHGRKEGAQLLTTARVRVAEDLSIPGPAVLGEGGPSYGLSGWIDSTGTRGSIYSQSDTNAECERARWPVDRACAETGDREMPSDTRFGDFDFDDAMTQLSRLEPQELRWKDGSTTTVALSFERGDAPICVGIEYSDGAFEPYRGRKLSTMLNTHVITDDGRIDTTIPVVVAAQWSEKRGVITVPGDGYTEVDHTLVVSGQVTRTGTELFRPSDTAADDAATFQSLGLHFTIGKQAVGGRVYLGLVRVDASEPQIAMTDALERGSLEGVCIEGVSRREDVATGSFGLKEFASSRTTN